MRGFSATMATLALLGAAWTDGVTFANNGPRAESFPMPAPKIDGLVESEAAWQHAAVLGNFTLLGKGQPAAAQTRVRVGHDSRALYVGFSCDLPPGSRPQATPRARDEEVYRDEAIELFLAPNPQKPQRYFHFIVNAAGSVQDEIGRDAAWNTEWQAKTIQAEGRWEAEIAIPWASLPIPPAAGDTWRVNFCRNCLATGELSSWAPCETTFHYPERFGYLSGINVDFVPLARQTLASRIKSVLGDAEAFLAAGKGRPGPLWERVQREAASIQERLKRTLAGLSAGDRSALMQAEEELEQEEQRLGAVQRLAARAEMASQATALGDGSWAVCIESPMRKIPAAQPYIGKPTREALVELARNEYESIQLVVVPLGEALRNVRVQIGALRGPGGAMLGRENVGLRRIGYVNVTQPSGGGTLPPGLLPDPLVDYAPEDVPAEGFLPLLVTVHAPETQRPGIYEGDVVVTARGHKPWPVRLRVRVWDFVLPRASFLRTCFQLMPGYLARYHDVWDGRTPPGWHLGTWVGADIQGIPNYFGYAEYQNGVTEENVLSGKHCAWISCTTWQPGERETPRAALMCDLTLQPGRYRFQVAYRMDDRTTVADMGVSAAGWRGLEPSTEWRRADMDFTIAEEGKVYFYLRLLSKGKVFFDEVSITDAEGKELAPNPGFDHIPAHTTETLLDKYRLDMLAHRASDMNVAAPTVEVEGDAVRLDWKDFDRLMARYIALGQNAFNIYWARVPGGWGSVAGLGDEQQRKISAEILRQTQAHLSEKGWLDLAYLYVIDEPGAAAFPAVQQVFDFVHSAAPGIKRLLTYGYGATLPREPGRPKYAELAGYVDIHVPHSDCFDAEYLRARQKLGEEVWAYVCISAQRPYLNIWGIDYPGTDPRVLFWQLHRFGITGFLYWAINYWEKDPWKDPMTYPGGNADGSLLYPGRDGPVDSLRWELTRDGIEDYDYLELARRKAASLRAAGKAAQAAKLEALYHADEVTSDWKQYTEEPQVIMAHRRKLAEALSAAK